MPGKKNSGIQRAPGTGLSKKAIARRRAKGPGKIYKKNFKAGRLIGKPSMAGHASARFRRPRRKRQGMGAGASNWKAVTDGLNNGDVITNNSTVEDTFELRTEKVMNISGTSAFTLSPSGGLYINPGNTTLFPIFSQIAPTYEQYRCYHLEFRIGTEAYVAVNGTASAGKVIMATNFDPDDIPFANDTSMENYEGMSKAPPFVSFKHDVIKAHKARKGRGKGNGMVDLPLKNYFVYSSGNQSAPVSGQDKFYDIGLFQLATASNAVTTEIGELYVTYSFTMIRPRQNIPSGSNLLQAHIVEYPATTAAAAGSAFLGTTSGANSIRSGSTLPVVCTGNTFTLPVAGSFLISAAWQNSVTGAATFSYGSNIAGEAIMYDNTQSSEAAVVSGISIKMAVVAVSASGTGAANTVTISVLTGLAVGTADIFISQISTGLLLKPLRKSVEVDDFKLLSEKCERLERIVRSLVVEVDDRKIDDLPSVLYSPPPLVREDTRVVIESPGVRSRFGLF